MSLNTMTIVITSPRIYTKLGVPITVTGVAQVFVNMLVVKHLIG